MKRTALAAVAVALLIAATSAEAHPLGNFSINRLTEVRVSADRVDLRYLLDQAEIPTVEERGLSRTEVLARKRGAVADGLSLIVDGQPVPLRLGPGARLSFPEGQAGLPTTRVELRLHAPVVNPRRVVLRDDTFPGRVGWRAIVAAPGEGTAVRTAVPSGDPTRGLRRYPEDLLSSPIEREEGTFEVRPGAGGLTAPRFEGGRSFTSVGDGEDGLAGLFEDAAAGETFLLVLLAAAFGWGALHALSPGHGKAMVAAYLVGTRGRPRHALALGATVTLTHTIGVFALGLVTLGLSQYVLPEDLYPWLTLASGLLVVVVGGGVLASRVRRARRLPHDHHHHHGPEDLTWRGLVGMGTAAGLIPCPSALVVLLAAISQHEVALGLALILAFSVGLAATLTALGLAVVYASRALPRLRFGGGVATVLPAVSALVIVAVGCVLTAQAVPEVV